MDLSTLKAEEGAKIEILHPVSGEVLTDDVWRDIRGKNVKIIPVTEEEIKEAEEQGTPLRDPYKDSDGNPYILHHIPITITVCGQDSRQYSEATSALARKRMARKGKDPTLSSMEADGIELLVRCTIGWSGIKENGEYLAFNEENCKKIYRDYKWIREQVDTAIMDRSLFLKS